MPDSVNPKPICAYKSPKCCLQELDTDCFGSVLLASRPASNLDANRGCSCSFASLDDVKRRYGDCHLAIARVRIVAPVATGSSDRMNSINVSVMGGRARNPYGYFGLLYWFRRALFPRRKRRMSVGLGIYLAQATASLHSIQIPP